MEAKYLRISKGSHWESFGTSEKHLIFSSVSKTVERFERRILEEFSKMFTDSNSFYFSLTGDMTNALQRQLNREPILTTNASTGENIELFPTWRDVDDRFFFNRSMVQELIDIGDQKLDAWITPFVQVTLDFSNNGISLKLIIFTNLKFVYRFWYNIWSVIFLSCLSHYIKFMPDVWQVLSISQQFTQFLSIFTNLLYLRLFGDILDRT